MFYNYITYFKRIYEAKSDSLPRCVFISFMPQEEGDVLDDAVVSAGFGEGHVQAHVPDTNIPIHPGRSDAVRLPSGSKRFEGTE